MFLMLQVARRKYKHPMPCTPAEAELRLGVEDRRCAGAELCRDGVHSLSNVPGEAESVLKWKTTFLMSSQTRIAEERGHSFTGRMMHGQKEETRREADGRRIFIKGLGKVSETEGE